MSGAAPGAELPEEADPGERDQIQDRVGGGGGGWGGGRRELLDDLLAAVRVDEAGGGLPRSKSQMDVLAGRVHGMLLGGYDNEEEDGCRGGSSSSSAAGPSTSSSRPGPPASPASAPKSAGVDEIRVAFDMWEDRRQRSDERREFGQIEAFISDEQHRGRNLRRQARVVQASEDLRLVTELGRIRDSRLSSSQGREESELQDRIAEVERAHLGRKLVVAKTAQMAHSDCRAQFSRVRAFFERMHSARLSTLEGAYQRTAKIQAIVHRLRGTDPRVAALEQQTAQRIYRRKEANLNELHMAQNVEEAAYLESIVGMLDRVQAAKEAAATELFELQVDQLRRRREALVRRERDMHNLREEANLEMAKMVAHYVEEEAQNLERDKQIHEQVDRAERGKAFVAKSSNTVVAVSELYDTIIWNVATSKLGLTESGGSSLYSSEYYSDGSEYYSEVDEDREDDDDDEGGIQGNDKDLDEDNHLLMGISEMGVMDDGSMQSGSSNGTPEDEKLSLIGKMHISRMTKELKRKEKTLTKKIRAEIKQERRSYRLASMELKQRHRRNVDTILKECVIERRQRRDEITERMNALANKQELTTKSMQESIEQDVKAMQDAWEEHKRLEDAEKSSFAKAQALISAQVFHEVRNALSSVVAMSEMTSTLQEDPTVSPLGLISSVNEMLEQNREVVSSSNSARRMMRAVPAYAPVPRKAFQA